MRRVRWVRRVQWVRQVQLGATGAEAEDVSTPAPTSSIVTTAAAPLETGGDARNALNRGPRSSWIVFGSTTRMPVSNCCGGGEGSDGVEGVGIDAHQQPALLLRDRRRRARRDLERDPQQRRAVVVLRRDARHAQVAEDEQARGRTKIEPRVVDRRERAADELHGNQPSVVPPRERRGQRHESAGRGHQRLIGRQHDRLVLVCRGDGARRRVFAHLELEQTREIVEPDHLMSLHFDGRQRAAPLARRAP